MGDLQVPAYAGLGGQRAEGGGVADDADPVALRQRLVHDQLRDVDGALHTDDAARIPRALEALEGAIGVDTGDTPLPMVLDRITA